MNQRLLILGTGAIARTHAEKFALIPGCDSRPPST